MLGDDFSISAMIDEKKKKKKKESESVLVVMKFVA